MLSTYTYPRYAHHRPAEIERPGEVPRHPVIVVGAGPVGLAAAAHILERGMKPIVLKASQTNHANPLGQFGYVGASTWFACVRLNDAWMAKIEVGVSALV